MLPVMLMSLSSLLGADGVWRLIMGVMAILCCTSAAAQELVVVQKVRVTNELGRGVKAEIRVVNAEDHESHFAYTDESGLAEPNQKCDRRHRLLAKPAILAYQILGKLPYCADEVNIRMHLPRISIALIKAGDKATFEKKYGLATMLYSEAAVRLSNVDPGNAKMAEFKAYEALGARLGIRDVTFFDPKQERHVLSYSAAQALVAFQRTHELIPSGQLDGATIRHLAGEPTFPHIREAYRAIERSSEKKNPWGQTP